MKEECVRLLRKTIKNIFEIVLEWRFGTESNEKNKPVYRHDVDKLIKIFKILEGQTKINFNIIKDIASWNHNYLYSKSIIPLYINNKNLELFQINESLY